MANNTERDCSLCIYGDNGPNTERCQNLCWKPDLPDFKPIPAELSRVSKLEKHIKELELENDRLRNICSLAEQRLRFSLDAFDLNHPRPPFRDASVPSVPKETNTKTTFLPGVDARGVSYNDRYNGLQAEPSGEAPGLSKPNPMKPR